MTSVALETGRAAAAAARASASAWPYAYARAHGRASGSSARPSRRRELGLRARAVPSVGVSTAPPRAARHALARQPRRDGRARRCSARTCEPFRGRKPPWFKVPPPGGSKYRELSADDPRREPPHGLPGGRLPERRRVLGARHRDVHDPRRHVHAALRVLQRQDGQADVERPARAAARRALGRADGPAPRGHHQRRPRRPARLRRRRLGRRDPLDPHAGAVVQGRVPHARLPRRGDAAGQGDRRAPRRLQPQRRGRPAPVSRRAPRLALGALAARAAQRQGDGRRRGRDQVRA